MATLSITVQGKSGARYAFNFKGDPAHLADWRAEGFDVCEIAYSVPAWAVNLGLLGAWLWATDALRFARRLVWR